jgi:DNA polymerase-1
MSIPDVRNTTESKMSVYNALDACNTLAISNQLMDVIRSDESYSWMYDFTVALQQPLMYMMHRGIKVDRQRLAQARTVIERQIKEVEEKIRVHFGNDFNPGSPKQIANYFYIKLGIPPYTKRGAGGESSITTDDKALQRLAKGTSTRRGRPEAGLIQEFRRLSKLKSTYLDITLDSDHRFRCSFNPRGTRFSRISSGKTVFDTGMNMQNLPEEFKTFLVSDPGMVLVELDKAKAEWVVVAYVADEENMIRVIESGADPHVHTARQILLSMGTDVSVEALKIEDKKIGHTTDPEEIHHLRNGIDEIRDIQRARQWLPRNMSCRQMGKKSNHGLNYREGYNQFALINEILESESKIIVNGYNRAYPGIDGWHQSVKGLLQKDRTLYDLFGRKYRFLGKFNDELWKSAISYNPQSTVGHLVNRGIIEIYRDQEGCMGAVDLLGQVHDSVLFQYPVREIENLCRAVYKCREYLEPTLSIHGRDFVIGTDMKIGWDWADMTEVRINNDLGVFKSAIEEGVSKIGEQTTVE